ncbi:MAG: glycosyltransferase family 4 protein [Phycisphaerae bacterium]|nr:glycosyltransferase family 4 protein [Phycisphaerae bacterium]
MSREIVHLIDAQTPRDMLDQMWAVREAQERVVSLGPPPAYRRLGEVRIESLHCPMGVKGWAWRRLAKRLPADAIVHVWSRDLLPPACRAAQCVGGGVVCSLPHLPAGAALEQMPWELGQFGHCLTIPTARAREELIQRCADARRVFVLPPAVRSFPKADSRDGDAVREALGFSPDEVVILLPAEMLRGAGHDWASWAHAICREVQDRGRLIIPGRHPREPRVRFFANTTGFGHEAIFTGDEFSREELLAAADVAAFLYERDLGVTALAEAMAAGVAILATTTPDVMEICENETTALLAQPGSPRSAAAAMLRLIEDADLRRRLGKAGRAHAEEHFRRTAVRTRLERIYATFGA